MKYYTGVGSREAPMYILYMMSQLAVIFEQKGYILRSGCALGVDSAFEDALIDPRNNSEIYIPDRKFPFKMGTKNKDYYICPEEKFGSHFNGLFNKATRLIHQYDIHKAWQRISNLNILKLHNRNMFQVLGIDLKSQSNFTICYTKAGETTYEETNIRTGGTATAINASAIHNVEVFNVAKKEHYIRLSKFIEDNKHLIDYNKLNKIVPRTELNKKAKYDIDFITDYNGYIEVIKKEKLKRDLQVGIIIKNESSFNKRKRNRP